MKKIQHLPSNGGAMSADKQTTQHVVLTKNQMVTVKGGTRKPIIGDDLIII